MEMVKAKSIIAHFLGMEVHEIDDSTVMNHTAVRSSLLLHRMYAALADEGYILEDPTSIENFGDLCRVISASGNDTVTKGLTMDLTASQSLERSEFFSSGIDIEKVSLFKNIDEYVSDSFFTENFTAAEIQYCISKPHPQQSFAGLFCAKEAIVKADNSFKKTKFNSINISHNCADKPIFEGFSLSISHSEDYAVAVAVKFNLTEFPQLVQKEIEQLVEHEKNKTIKFSRVYFALSLSFITLFLLVFFYDFY
jgi:holo-[acyl-carrier protein] synthase